MLDAYHKLIRRLKAGGITPKHYILDIEISEAYKKSIKIEGMRHELLQQDVYQNNVIEKAIHNL